MIISFSRGLSLMLGEQIRLSHDTQPSLDKWLTSCKCSSGFPISCHNQLICFKPSTGYVTPTCEIKTLCQWQNVLLMKRLAFVPNVELKSKSLSATFNVYFLLNVSKPREMVINIRKKRAAIQMST